MKKLIKLSALQTILCLLFAATTFAQTTTRTIVITPPDTLGACMPNAFVAKVKSQGARLTIGQHISMGNNIVSCFDTGMYVIADNIIGSTSNPVFDTVTKEWSVNILDADTVTIYYHVSISCGIIPLVGDSINNIKLEQTFTDANGLFNYAVAGAANPLITDIAVPLLIDRSPSAAWNASYLDTLDVFYYYANGGTANARINFTFNDDTSHYCNNLQPLPLGLAYKNGSGNFVNYISGQATNITLNASDTLVFRSRNIVTGCPGTCTNAKVYFSWHCNIAAPAANHFCATCKGTDTTVYNLAPNNSPKIYFTRQLPATLPEYSCMNDTAFVKWKYILTNSSLGAVGAMDTATILLGNSSFNLPEYLSLIDTASFKVTPIRCNNCNLKITKIVNANALCAGAVPTALQYAQIQLNDFKHTDTLLVEFETYRCVENNILILNEDKYYNRWSFTAKGNTICGTAANGTFGTVGPLGTWPYNQGTIDRNAGAGVADVAQNLLFVPSVSDLSVDPGQQFGDSVTMEIELKGFLGEANDYTLVNCPNGSVGCTMQGWVRAIVHCEQNLIVPTPAIGLRLRYLNPATNQYIYKAPDLYHTSIQPNECRPADYYYYFNLNDPLMRVMLDSGVCLFKLQACCNGDIARTPYSVTWHLLADPSGSCNNLTYVSATDTVVCSGTGCEFLPLSSSSGLIACHCPGCQKIGVISDSYTVFRTSLGLEDTRNIGIADTNAQTITPGSAWFQMYGDRLKTNISSFNDLLSDRLVAHTEPGAPSAGGYDLAMLNQRGAYLKYLQLSRLFTAAFDTMKLSVTDFTLYIDAPNSANPNCINCTEFDVDTNFRTQHIITVSGTDIYHFLDTITNANHFLYNFSAYDSAGSFYGNLYDQLFTDYYFTDTLDTLKGFFENQRYRLQANMRECGGFAAPVSGPYQVEDYLKQSLILNKMWLSGKKQVYSAFDDNLGSPNTVAEANAWGWTFDTLNTSLTQISQQFADSFIFVCETFGTYHYFYSQNAYNGSGYKPDTSCQKTMILYSDIKSAAGASDLHPFEFKLPAYEPQTYTVNIQPGYHTVPNSGRVYYVSYSGQTGGISIQTPKRFFPVPSGSGTITIADSTLPQSVCMFADSRQANGQWFPNDSNLYIAGIRYVKIVEFNIAPDFCPADSFKLNQNDIAIDYTAASYNCQPATVCDTVFHTVLYTSTGTPSRPNLSLNFPTQITATQHRVCMDMTFNNNQTAQETFSEASHVYAVLPANTSYLSNWQYSVNGAAFQPVTGGIVPVKDTLLLNKSATLRLCADYNTCISSDSAFTIYWGWNCNGYPVLPYNTNNVCFADSAQIEFLNSEEAVDPSFKVHDSTYTLCRNFEVSTEIINAGSGAVYPLSVFLDSLATSLQVQQVIITNCNTNQSDTLQTQIATNTWAISGNNLTSIGIVDSSLANSECINVRAILNPTCNYLNINTLPNIVVTMVNLCNDTIRKTAARLYNVNSQSNDTIVWNGSSDCSDCFTVTKTADADTVAIGDTVTYTITICNYSAGVLSLSAIEVTPPSPLFQQTFTNLPVSSIFLPPGVNSCLGYIVQGFFTASSSCPTTVNKVIVNNDNSSNSESDSVCVLVVTDLCSVGANIIIPDSSFSAAYGSGISNSIVYIAGRFYINQAFTFTNCLVYVKSGGQIIVNSNYEDPLTLDSTNVIGCDSLWRGIYLTKSNFLNYGGAVRLINGSSIRDANEAIFANDNCYVYSRNSNLYNNVKGIVVPQKNNGNLINNTTLNIQSTRIGMTATAFKPNYISQPAHGAIPTSGLELNDWFGTFGDTARNDFFNMVNGIVGFRSQFTSRNNYFENIRLDTTLIGKPPAGSGYAIESKGTLSIRPGNLTVLKSTSTPETITNCYGGTYTNYSSLTASNLNMSVSYIGINATQCKNGLFTSATGDTINSNFRAIYFWLNAGAQLMDASANTIVVQNHAAGAGILLFETTAGFANYKVQYNKITLNAANTGIHSSGAFKSLITDNHVFQNYSTGTIETKGISVTGGDSVTLSCNTMTTDYAQTIFKVYGIYFSGSKAYNISCNKAYNHYYGNYFMGKCNNSDENFKGNEMHNNKVGLQLYNNAEIGVQTLRGNLFYNYTGGNAINSNTSATGISASAFFANTGLTQTPNPVPSNWFTIDPGNIYSCGNNCNSSLALNGGNNNDERKVALDLPTSTEFIDENKSMSKSNLFEKLSDDIAFRNSEQLFTDFYNDNINGAIGKLYSIKEKIKDGISFSPSSIGLIAIADSIINQKLDSLEIIGNDPSILNYDVLKSSLLTSISIIEQTRNSIVQQETGSGDILLNDASQIIATVSPQELPEENNKFANEMNVLYEKFGIDALLPFYNQILAIAQQCPAAGGNAVYIMRVFVDYFDASITYNDDATCLQLGFYRQINSIESKNVNQIKIVPNPATDKIDIYLTTLAEGFCSVTISNYLGQIVYEKSLDCKQIIHPVNISKLSQGVYSVKIKLPKNKIDMVKLVVTR